MCMRTFWVLHYWRNVAHVDGGPPQTEEIQFVFIVPTVGVAVENHNYNTMSSMLAALPNNRTSNLIHIPETICMNTCMLLWLTTHSQCRRSAMKNMFIPCSDRTYTQNQLLRTQALAFAHAFHIACGPTADTRPPPSQHPQTPKCGVNAEFARALLTESGDARAVCVRAIWVSLRVVRRFHRPWCKSWRVAECDAEDFGHVALRYAYVAIASAAARGRKNRSTKRIRYINESTNGRENFFRPNSARYLANITRR